MGELNTKVIYEIIAYGLQIAGFRDRHIIDETVEDRLARVQLLGRNQRSVARERPRPGFRLSIVAPKHAKKQGKLEIPTIGGGNTGSSLYDFPKLLRTI